MIFRPARFYWQNRDLIPDRLWRPWCAIFGHKWQQKLSGWVCHRCRVFTAVHP